MSKWTAYIETGEQFLERQKLNKSRVQFREEMRKVLACKSKKAKLLLWNEWKAKYSETPFYIKELVHTARNLHLVREWAILKVEGES